MLLIFLLVNSELFLKFAFPRITNIIIDLLINKLQELLCQILKQNNDYK